MTDKPHNTEMLAIIKKNNLEAKNLKSIIDKPKDKAGAWFDESIRRMLW